MDGLDIFGHIFYAFLLVGMILLARKSKWGWACRFVGEFGWVIIGVIIGMSSIWSWGIVFMCIDFYGFMRWRKKVFKIGG